MTERSIWTVSESRMTPGAGRCYGHSNIPNGSKLPTSLQSPRPRLKSKIDQNLYQNFIKALEGITNYIPAKAIQNLIHIFGGSDLLRAIVFKDLRVISLSETRKCALIIPVPDMERFNPKPAFGGRATYTWNLVHGTTVSAAAAILAEGLIRLADWQRNADPSKSQLPTFGIFSIGQQVSRNDIEIVGEGIETRKRTTAHPDRWHLQRIGAACFVQGRAQR